MAKFDRQDLVGKLQEQMGFLQRSADLFDSGVTEEALRLAVTLRVLLHDTSASLSLLTQLDVKQDLDFVTTGMAMPQGGALWGRHLRRCVSAGLVDRVTSRSDMRRSVWPSNRSPSGGMCQ
jgi:hypothetical protein